jgi:dihydroorotase
MTGDGADGGAFDLVVRGGTVVAHDGTEVAADVGVRDGRIVAVAPSLPGDGAVELDASGCLVLPGLVDLHVHLREPGGEDAEDVASGAAAGVAGGFTDLVAMGNTNPPHDSAAVVEKVRAAGERAGLARVHPAGCVTVGRAGEQLTDLRALHRAGCQVFTDDGDPVADAMLMRRALEYVGAIGGVIADHCEDHVLTAGAQMHEGRVSGELGLQGWPTAAEEIIVARDIVLAEFTGCRVHLQHVSTKGSVELLREAKARGVPVTAEVTPHHLTLTDDKVRTFDPVFKVNPPIRSAEHVAAVRAALADGTIDAVATDHAPHTPERKEEWTSAACGMLGLETALPLVWALVDEGVVSLARLVDAFVTRPVAIAGLDRDTAVVEGTAADLCVFDPTVVWEVDPRLLRSKARNTPFAGMALTGKVRHTVCDGRIVFTDGADGEEVVADAR